jgi:peptidylprolyl isomerase
MRGWFVRGPIRAAIFFMAGSAFAQGVAMAVEAGPDVVARMGGSEFTASMLDSFVRSLAPAVRKQALADRDLMNRLIGTELARLALLNEAKAKKWEQRPDVARQIEKARDEVILGSFLASIAVLPRDYPSESDIKSAYDLNRDSFMVPRQYRLQQIFVRLPPGGDKKAIDAAQHKAEDLAKRAKARNAVFEDIARTNSEHQSSASKGGDLGWADQSQLVAEIRNEVAGMNKGEISDPILGSSGWHIVRLVDTKPAAPRPLAEVKDSLVATLRERKMQDLQQGYVARLLEKDPVAVNEARLRKVFESAP